MEESRLPSEESPAVALLYRPMRQSTEAEQLPSHRRSARGLRDSIPLQRLDLTAAVLAEQHSTGHIAQHTMLAAGSGQRHRFLTCRRRRHCILCTITRRKEEGMREFGSRSRSGQSIVPIPGKVETACKRLKDPVVTVRRGGITGRKIDTGEEHAPPETQHSTPGGRKNLSQD